MPRPEVAKHRKILVLLVASIKADDSAEEFTPGLPGHGTVRNGREES